MKAGLVVWITGLPSAGKSTLAGHLFTRLDALGAKACLLDGDAVRQSLSPAPGYSTAERAAFYETLARLAALLAAQGLIVLVPATAHRRAYRERARQLAPGFVEVWIDTPLAECVARDSKGLYRASRTGSATTVPGADEPYEPPSAPDFTAHGATDRSELEQLARCVLNAHGSPR